MKKAEKWYITFIKSFIIGLGVIFPISSSVLAIVLGLYNKILDVINNFFTCFKKEFKFLLILIAGVGSSIIVGSLFLDYTLNKFPIATLLFFVGLIIGGIPMLMQKTQKKYTFSNMAFLILGIVVLMVLSLMTGSSNAVITSDAWGLFKLVLVGILGAGSMIIPGISGSVMLVVVGYYEPLLEIVSSTVKFQNLWPNLLYLGFFGIGLLIGLVLVSKLMAYLLEKYEVKSYFVIIGFIIGSIFNLLAIIFNHSFMFIETIIGILLMILGFLVSFKFLREDK